MGRHLDPGAAHRRQRRVPGDRLRPGAVRSVALERAGGLSPGALARDPRRLGRPALGGPAPGACLGRDPRRDHGTRPRPDRPPGGRSTAPRSVHRSRSHGMWPGLTATERGLVR